MTIEYYAGMIEANEPIITYDVIGHWSLFILIWVCHAKCWCYGDLKKNKLHFTYISIISAVCGFNITRWMIIYNFATVSHKECWVTHKFDDFIANTKMDKCYQSQECIAHLSLHQSNTCHGDIILMFFSEYNDLPTPLLNWLRKYKNFLVHVFLELLRVISILHTFLHSAVIS